MIPVYKSIASLLIYFCMVATNSAGQESSVNLYKQKIKPLLKERCFACHGALKQESELRVDTIDSMQDYGILEDNILLNRLTSKDDAERMPPEGEPLSKQELVDIKTWIAAGAPAPDNEQAEADPMNHWAFQKIERPELPDLGESNPVDAFLSKEQHANGLKPIATAQRSLLLRRIYLDITGLPPTTEQLLSDLPIDETIDSLIDSPQYGERWGRHWMDVWRYSDWYGLDSQLRNSQKHLWHWRDWIIDSLNADKGYDRMIMEMIAGDEIAPTDLETVGATGFLARNYYLFNRTTWLDDTIEHTAKSFLGLTLNCAKCHDHKYDPIDHEDYYRFRAIFEPHHVRLDALPGNTDYNKDGLPRVYDDKPDAPTFLHLRGDPAQPVKDNPVPAGPPKFLGSFAQPATPIDLPTEAWAPGVRKYVQTNLLTLSKSQLDSARANLQQQQQKEAIAAAAKAEVKVSALLDDFKKSRPDVWETIGRGWRYQGGLLSQTEPTMDRNCLRTKAQHPRDFELTLNFQTTGGKQYKSTGIRFDVDEQGENAHIVYVSAFVNGPKVQLAHTVAGRNIYPANAKADLPIRLNQDYVLNIKVRDDLINVALDGEFLFAYRLPPRKNGSIELFAFDSTADFYAIEVKPLASDVTLTNTDKQAAVVDSAQAVDLATAQLKLAEAKLAALDSRIAADNATLKKMGNGSPELAAQLHLQAAVAKAEVDLIKADATKKAAAIKERERAQNALTSGNLPTLDPLSGSQRALDQSSHKASQYPPVYSKTSTGRRTALANWITHRDNPLTARVAVNHIWTRHFGTPLVESVFDFGRRSPQPLHYDLLDYLAIELIESNWSMKHLHRLILKSKAWQRSSSNLGADPNTLTGDPENHYYWRMNNRRMESQVLRDSLFQLSGQLDLTAGGPSVQAGPNVRRRSLYLFHSRDGRDKFVSIFDDADVFHCYRRNESIVPQQALALMNSREAIESAGLIASRLNADLTDTEFARAAFLQLLARPPTKQEVAACLDFLKANPERSQFVHVLLNHNDFQVIR
ncbi:PSD1 and planctomycete cytochrome C domain-containing protein [bacterium]|nr:PSD1 and planctomycete cytochrome C domain-containing protein [bacterium]